MRVNLKHLLLPLIICAALVAGCGPRVNQASYEKIQNDMTSEQVNDILGKPTKVESFGIGNLSATTARWVGKTDTITVTYGNDRVKLKSYSPSQQDGDAK